MDSVKERNNGKKRRDRQDKNDSNYTNVEMKKEIDSFLNDDDLMVISFPPTLSKSQRSYVHRYVQRFGYKSKSTGKGDNFFFLLFHVEIIFQRKKKIIY